MLKVFRIGFMILFFQVFSVQAQEVVSFMEFNIWQEGTSIPNGFNKIKDVIIEVNPDIVGFTEVRNYHNEDWTTKLVDALSTEGYQYHGNFAGGDVSLISKHPIISSSVIYNQEGSIVRFDIDINGQTIVVGVAHLDYTHYACYLPRGYQGGDPDWKMIEGKKGQPKPVLDVPYILSYNLNSQRDEQIAAFLTAIENESKPIVLMGDFNEPSYTDWSENTGNMFDHHGLVIPWQNVRALHQHGFIDAYREYFPNEVKNPGITWPSFVAERGSTSWTPLADERDRIDFMLYKSEDIQTEYVSLVGPKASYVYNQADTSFTSNDNFLAEKLPWPSDHKAVYARLRFLQTKTH